MPDTQDFNCALEICCLSIDNRKIALGRLMQKDLGQGPYDPGEVVAWIYAHFDLAPVGTLTSFKAAIADHARGPAWQG